MFSEEVGGEGDSHRPVQLNTFVSIFQAGQPKETIQDMCVHTCVFTYHVHVHECKSVRTYNNVLLYIHMYIHQCMYVYVYVRLQCSK